MKTQHLMIKILVVLAALAIIFQWLSAKTVQAGQIPERTQLENPYSTIDAYIEQQIQRLNIPGASLAIVEGDQIVHMKGFGVSSPGGQTPTSQIPYVLCSLTKSFTALAIMQLVEAGKIELDAPVQRYLPWFHLADPKASTQMAVRHLLNQTSGLPQMAGMLPLADFDSHPDATQRQARALATLQLTRPVGAAFEYSNMNYNLLGLIIEAASGETYPDYIQAYIFNPLGMRHSYTSQAAAKQNGLAVGYRYWFTVPFAISNLPLPQGSLPSGQLISSAEDMGHYLIAHLNGGLYGGVQILSAAGIETLHRGGMDANQMGVPMGKYAMGWFDDESGQTRILWHNGEAPDFFTFMALVPEQKKGLVLLFNADQSMMNIAMTEAAMGAAHRLADDPPTSFRFGFMLWILRALLLLPLLQIAGVAVTLSQLHRWRLAPASRPSRVRLWGLHILLPLFFNLLVALPLLGMLYTDTLRFLMLFLPDFSWLALICGGFSLLWIFLRTGLILTCFP